MGANYDSTVHRLNRRLTLASARPSARTVTVVLLYGDYWVVEGAWRNVVPNSMSCSAAPKRSHTHVHAEDCTGEQTAPSTLVVPLNAWFEPGRRGFQLACSAWWLHERSEATRHHRADCGVIDVASEPVGEEFLQQD